MSISNLVEELSLSDECDDHELKMRRFRVKRQKKFLSDLRRTYIGQYEAVDTLFSIIRQRENGWSHEGKPLVFLFLGPSGVGKTELAKCLANYFSQTDKGVMHRFDMSEYQESHSISRLIGSPPGYVKCDAGGSLTNKLRENPESIVLFDEIEKASSNLFTVFLQLFDEGRLTDGLGVTVECPRAIFILTSNVATEEIKKYATKQFKDLKNPQMFKASNNFKTSVMYPLLKESFKRDEFLGRITEFVYFWPFIKEELSELVDIQLNYWQKLAKLNHEISLNWDKNVSLYLCEHYNDKYGARSISRAVDNLVIKRIAELFDEEKIHRTNTVIVNVDYGISKEGWEKPQLVFKVDFNSSGTRVCRTY